MIHLGRLGETRDNSRLVGQPSIIGVTIYVTHKIRRVYGWLSRDRGRIASSFRGTACAKVYKASHWGILKYLAAAFCFASPSIGVASVNDQGFCAINDKGCLIDTGFVNAAPSSENEGFSGRKGLRPVWDFRDFKGNAVKEHSPLNINVISRNSSVVFEDGIKIYYRPRIAFNFRPARYPNVRPDCTFVAINSRSRSSYGRFSGSDHLLKLSIVDESNSHVDENRCYANSDHPPLAKASRILDIAFGISIIAVGIVISWWGWWGLVSSRVLWGLNRRLSVWLPCNAVASILFWHGGALLLRISLGL